MAYKHLCCSQCKPQENISECGSKRIKVSIWVSQTGYPKSRFAQCFSHGQSGAMGFEKEYHKSELLQSHQDIHDSHIMLLVKFHHLVKVMFSRFLHYKVTIFFSLFFRSKQLSLAQQMGQKVEEEGQLQPTVGTPFPMGRSIYIYLNGML